MIIKESISGDISALAAAIHYPECWDTAAYPDLLSALREVTASAGCSACKSPVEQAPVAYQRRGNDGIMTGHLVLRNDIGERTLATGAWIPLYRHPAPDQQRPTILSASARHFRQMQNEVESLAQERDKLIHAVADHLTVRAEQRQKIQALEAYLDGYKLQLSHLRENLEVSHQQFEQAIDQRNAARRNLKNFEDRILELDDALLSVREKRDALRSQLDRVTWALEHLLERGIAPPDRNCSCHISPPCNDCVEWSGLREAVEHAESALAAVREPADHIEHDLEKVRGPTSSHAGEGGDRG